jgi:hypothetical protein
MKNPLSDLYEQILLKEAEKSALQNPSNDEIGDLAAKQDLFGEKPKPVEGPEKAKLQQGPSYKETTGTTTSPKTSSSFKGTAPAKETKAEKPKEMKDEEVDPTEKKEDSEDKKEKKKEKHEESFTMSAFETLFKKTITEELNESPVEETPTEDSLDLPTDETETPETNENDEEHTEEDEGDLISDLKDLQDKLATILSKLEEASEEGESEEGDQEYTEEEFDEEFSNDDEEGEEEEEEPLKESSDKPKPLSPSKGKTLMNKKNKVGKLSAKGGKAHGGSLKTQPKPTALGDKKKQLQHGSHVKSNISKGEFFK